ncbi:MAG: hypothetical protein ABIT08_05085 [Bacteroidia bacterium]
MRFNSTYITGISDISINLWQKSINLSDSSISPWRKNTTFFMKIVMLSQINVP